MPSLYDHIGQKIRALRLAYPKGQLNQEQLAAKLKIAANTVSRWETGTYKPTAEDLERLARFFGVSIAVFFPGEQVSVQRIAALTSATGGLSENDLEELVRYAEFRKARQAIKGAKRARPAKVVKMSKAQIAPLEHSATEQH